LSVEQFSPVIPHDYQASSYPLAIFTYTATNPSNQPVSVGLLFTWKNSLFGSEQDLKAGALVHGVRQDGDLVGIQLGRSESFSSKEWDGTLAIAAQKSAGVSIGVQPGFDVSGDGSDVWSDFAASGALHDSRTSASSVEGKSLGAAISATFTLQPGESVQVPFF